jgi:hypothetical protein
LADATEELLNAYPVTHKPPYKRHKRLRRVLTHVGALAAAIAGAQLGVGGTELAELAVSGGLGAVAQESIKASGQFAASSLYGIVQNRLSGKSHEQDTPQGPGLAADLQTLHSELKALLHVLNTEDYVRIEQRGDELEAAIHEVRSRSSDDTGLGIALDRFGDEAATAVKKALERDLDAARQHAAHACQQLGRASTKAMIRLRRKMNRSGEQ